MSINAPKGITAKKINGYERIWSGHKLLWTWTDMDINVYVYNCKVVTEIFLHL
jgi:hypothetical protein